jgi:hypothetical protein
MATDYNKAERDRDPDRIKSPGEKQVEREAAARERNEQKRAEKEAREKMELYGTGTAKVTSTDALSGEVDLKAVQWKSTGPIVVSPDPEDPTTAQLYATAVGTSTITASMMDEFGVTNELAHVDVDVVEKGVAHESKIELSLQPAKSREERGQPPIPEETTDPAAPKIPGRRGKLATTPPNNKSDLTPAGAYQQQGK